MRVTINGEARRVEAATVTALLAELEVDARAVAVELSGAIVPKSAYGSTALAEGDAVEILRFIGGG